MKKINQITGKTIPLIMDDVDTDMIIPAQYLTSVTREGYGEFLFKRLRENQRDFIWNQPQFKESNILIARENFGCGSSREHAVWALQQSGIEAIIAVSFADIFFSNSAKNGLLLISLPKPSIEKLQGFATSGSYVLNIHLEKQIISSRTPEIEENFSFDSFRKYCFLNGLDDLDYLLSHQDMIDQFKEREGAL